MRNAIHNYYTYIVASHSRVIYAGVANDLACRVSQHKIKKNAGFTSRYNADRLVWYERFANIKDAIAQEKKIKGWTRAKKIALIESMNPGWFDLLTAEGQEEAGKILREYAQDDRSRDDISAVVEERTLQCS
jgi:putative endonuclease